MFALTYLIVVFLAALPLMQTILRQRGKPQSIAFIHRIYRDLAYIAVAVIAILGLEAIFEVTLQNYWFAELGQKYRYWFALGLRAAIFAAVFVFGGLFIGLNLRAACRPVAIMPRSAPWLSGLIISAVVAFGATGLWTPLMGFLGATPSGATDPVFGKDLSFYLLSLPLYEEIVYLGIWVLVLTIAAAIGIGFLFYPRQGQPWRYHSHYPTLIDIASPRDGHEGDVHFLAIPRNAWDSWARQAIALGAMLCLCFGFGRFLGRYHLIIDGHSGVVAGASFVDIHFGLPAYAAIIAGWLFAATALALAACIPNFRRWLLAAPSHWAVPCGVFAAVYLGGAIVPIAVEHLYVGPNQITLEQPYLVRSIAGTRQAYGVVGPNVEEQEFAVSTTPLTRDDLDKNAATLRDARIWDWRALEPQLQQTQGLRPYYTFGSVDIDRYLIDGVERQVMITARELDVEKLPAAAQVWVNLALKYTHGYGAVAVPVNEMDGRGNPVLWAHDIPIQAKSDLAVTHGEIYYGILTRDRVYVHTTEKEFDFPQGDANAETVYGGERRYCPVQLLAQAGYRP